MTRGIPPSTTFVIRLEKVMELHTFVIRLEKVMEITALLVPAYLNERCEDLVYMQPLETETNRI